MKKTISLLLTLLMLASVITALPFTANAKGETPIPNNSGWNQFYVTHDTTEYFGFNMPNTGRLKINLFAATYDGRIGYKLYDNDYENCICDDRMWVNSNAPSTDTIDRVLTKGKYHLVLEIGDESGYIKLKTKYSNYKCNTKDNSTYESPNVLKSGSTATGAYTCTNSDTSWFKITVPSRRIVQLNLYSYIDGFGYTFYNRDLSKEYFSRSRYWWNGLDGNETSPATEMKKLTLNKGTYYFKCYGNNGKYKIKYTSYTKPKLNCTRATIKVRNKKQLKVSGGTGTIKWSTSNKKIAVVNSSGKVTAKRRGNCVITAKRNGYNLRCSVYVR